MSNSQKKSVVSKLITINLSKSLCLIIRLLLTCSFVTALDSVLVQHATTKHARACRRRFPQHWLSHLSWKCWESNLSPSPSSSEEFLIGIKRSYLIGNHRLLDFDIKNSIYEQDADQRKNKWKRKKQCSWNTRNNWKNIHTYTQFLHRVYVRLINVSSVVIPLLQTHNPTLATSPYTYTHTHTHKCKPMYCKMSQGLDWWCSFSACFEHTSTFCFLLTSCWHPAQT